MRKSQLILLGVFILLSGLIYFALSRNAKSPNKELKEESKTVYVPVREIHNTTRLMTLTSYGQITPQTQIIVSMEVQGKLEKGDLTVKPGTNFKKGQILFRVNNEEAFFTLSSRKSALLNLVLNALPDIEMDFPSEKNKWIGFMNDLSPSKLLPELPIFSSAKERMFITSRNIVSEYYSLRSMEARMEKYFFAAPFNGTVLDVFAEPGAIANPGAQIAKIAQTDNFEVKVPISIEELGLFKENSTAKFIDAKGNTVASGKIIRISDAINQQTQSTDVYYAITPEKGATLYSGMYVNVSIQKEAMKETMTLPRTAVNEGKVKILDGEKIKIQEIMIAGSKPDSVFVTGLKDGKLVVLEQIEDFDASTIFKGIKR